MIESIIDCYRDTTTWDKLIFPSTITHILTQLHVTIPFSPLFYVMGAMSKVSIWRSAAQLAVKRPCVEPSDVAPTNPTGPSSQSSSSSAPSSSFRAPVSLVEVTQQLQHMHVDFGSHLDHLSNEMCQMNIKIGHITCRQSRLGGFAPSSSPEHVEESSSLDGGDDDGDDASGSEYDDEMTNSQ